MSCPAGRRLRTTLAAVCLLASVTGSVTPLAASQADPVTAIRAELDAAVKAQDWKVAIEATRRLIAEGETRADLAVQAEGWHRLGQGHTQLKAHAESREALLKALAMHEQRGDRVAVGRVRQDLGLLAWYQGDGPGVRTHYGAAAEEFARAGRLDLQVSALRSRTFAPDMSVDDKVAALEEAWTLAGGIDDARTKGLLLHHLGDMLVVRGDAAAAIDKLEAADPQLAKAGLPREYAALLTSLGRTLRLHGLPDRAIPYYERAFALQAESRDIRGQAQTLHALSISLMLSGRAADATSAAARAIALAEQSEDPGMVALTHLGLADALHRIPDHQRALEAARTALRHSTSPNISGMAQVSIAYSYLELGRLDEAIRASDESMAQLEPLGAGEPLASAYDYRARIRARQGDVPGALDSARRGLAIVEKLRAGAVPGDAMKRSFLDPWKGAFSRAIDLHHKSGDAAGGLELAERGRARALTDLLATRGTATRTASAMAARGAGPNLPSLPMGTVPTLAGIRAQVARANTTLVSYWVDADATFIWVVRPNGEITSKRVAVAESRLKTLASRVWKGAVPTALPSTAATLVARSGESVTLGASPGPALRELYDLLIAPVRAALPKESDSLLSIEPHGPLFTVAFAALMDPQGRYLVETYRLHEVPSVDLLGGSRPPALAVNRRVLLVANPSPMPPSADGRGLAALPGALDEVRAIARLLPVTQVTSLVGGEATETRVRAEAPAHSAIHLATHGLVFNDRPFDSYLALARQGTALAADGRLGAEEIYSLTLDAEIVVLSACRTATGSITGDGVVGLARAFFYAGTPSVLATLWDLADVSAQHLLPEFYRHWLRDGDRSAALQQAQRAMIAALRRGEIKVATPIGDLTLPEHPALWAGLVLLGQP